MLPRSGSSGLDSRPARCADPGGPRGRAQPQALVPEQAAALRRRRERRTLAATLARSSVACVVWAGVVSMTPPGRVAAAPALLAVVPLDRHSPARRYARTAPGPACYSRGLATFNSSHRATSCALPPLRGPERHPEERRRADESARQTVAQPRKGSDGAKRIPKRMFPTFDWFLLLGLVSVACCHGLRAMRSQPSRG